MVTLNGLALDGAHSSVREKHEEVGGRDERRITLTGLVTGLSSVAGIEARLDDILAAASASEDGVPLSLRPGRRFLVTRSSFTREVSTEALVGSFTLGLSARDPFEESEEVTEAAWTVTASGDVAELATGGNTHALPVIRITASGAVENPRISDGARTLAYAGVVGDGETLEIDAAAGRVLLGEEDVTPYTTGLFPRIDPEGATLTYTDGPGGSHAASVTVSYRDRWW